MCSILNGDKEFEGDVKINQFLLRKKVNDWIKKDANVEECDKPIAHHRFHKI